MSASTATYDKLEPNFTFMCDFDPKVTNNRILVDLKMFVVNVFLVDLYTVHFELFAIDKNEEVIDQAVLMVSGSVLANGNLSVINSIHKSSDAWDFIQIEEIEALMDVVHSFNKKNDGSRFDLSSMLHSVDGDLSDYLIENPSTALPLLH